MLSEAMKQELPFTNDGLNVYILEAEKRLAYLQPFVVEYKKIKNRIKAARERIEIHKTGKGL